MQWKFGRSIKPDCYIKNSSLSFLGPRHLLKVNSLCWILPACAGAGRAHWHPGAPALRSSCSSPSAPGWPAAPPPRPAAGWLCAPRSPAAPSGPPGHGEHHPGGAGYPVRLIKGLRHSKEGVNILGDELKEWAGTRHRKWQACHLNEHENGDVTS